ncbi:hypothetical protein ACJX0J_010828, partial [Zea mays]
IFVCPNSIYSFRVYFYLDVTHGNIYMYKFDMIPFHITPFMPCWFFAQKNIFYSNLISNIK